MNFEIQIVTTISRYLKRFFKCSSAAAVHDFDLFVLILFINIIFSIERKCSRPISFGLTICICEGSTHIATYSLRTNTTTSNCHTKVCVHCVGSMYIISVLFFIQIRGGKCNRCLFPPIFCKRKFFFGADSNLKT